MHLALLDVRLSSVLLFVCFRLCVCAFFSSILLLSCSKHLSFHLTTLATEGNVSNLLNDSVWGVLVLTCILYFRNPDNGDEINGTCIRTHTLAVYIHI